MTDPPVIIGVDPGKSVGLSVLSGGFLVAAYQGESRVVLHVLRETLRFYEEQCARVMVAIERFVVLPGTARKSQQTEALQVFGAVKNMAEVSGHQVVEQAPSDARKIATDDDLRRLGLWTSPRDVGRPDANDVNMATRHALLALATRHASAYDRLLTTSET